MLPPEISRRFFLSRAAGFGFGLIMPWLMTRRAEAAFRLGDVPSAITLNGIRGESITIPSDFTGKVVLIHFWASWCLTCLGEMKTLDSIYRQYGGKSVIPCSIGLGERRETALRYLKDVEITYPVLLDPVSSTRRLYGVAGIPTYFVLDRQGIVRHKILGKANPEGLSVMVRSLL